MCDFINGQFAYVSCKCIWLERARNVVSGTDASRTERHGHVAVHSRFETWQAWCVLNIYMPLEMLRLCKSGASCGFVLPGAPEIMVNECKLVRTRARTHMTNVG